MYLHPTRRIELQGSGIWSAADCGDPRRDGFVAHQLSLEDFCWNWSARLEVLDIGVVITCRELRICSLVEFGFVAVWKDGVEGLGYGGCGLRRPWPRWSVVLEPSGWPGGFDNWFGLQNPGEWEFSLFLCDSICVCMRTFKTCDSCLPKSESSSPVRRMWNLLTDTACKALYHWELNWIVKHQWARHLHF